MRKHLAAFFIAIAMLVAIISNTTVANHAENLGLSVAEQQVPDTELKRVQILASRGELRTMDVIATAYDLSYDSCEKYPDDDAYGITATGTFAKEGTIAVDPDIIPLNTRIYIPDLNIIGVAEDVGGAIVGHRIDIFMNNHSDAINFGRKKMRIYLLGR